MKSSSHIKRIVHHILPPGTRRHHIVRRVLDNIRAQQTDTLSYEQWVAQVESKHPRPVVNSGPLISIVVPAYNTPDKYLLPLIDSILDQTYAHWELVLVNGSPDKTRSRAISDAAKRDNRIHEVLLTSNKGIADTTNVGLAQAKGEFIAFMDHDDTLAPFALAEVASALTQDPEIDLFYSDEDKLSDDGQHRLLPFFKPGWSPDLFLNVNYLAHFVVVRAKLAHKIDGIRLGYDGAQDYDFLLRILDHNPKVHAVQHMSYHWRQAEGSTGLNLGEKSYATDAGLRALQDYVKRNNIGADVVEVENRPTEYRLKYHLRGEPTVYLLATSGWSESSLKSLLAQTSYKRIKTISSFEDIQDKNGLLLYLTPDLKPSTSNWLVEMIGLAQQSQTGWVGGAIYDAEGRSTGIGYTPVNSEWKPMMAGGDQASWGLMGSVLWPRNVLAINPDCALVEISKLDQSTTAPEPFHSSLKLSQKGYRNIYWPFVAFESQADRIAMSARAPGEIIDPYINSNLEVSTNGIAFKTNFSKDNA